MAKLLIMHQPVKAALKPFRRYPLFTQCISAGFPSPAEDYIENHISLDELLINHPSATFFVRVTGDSMVDAGILPNAILIADRSVTPKHNDIVIAVVDGEFTVKRLVKWGKDLWLVPENKKYKPIKITSDLNFEIWSKVIACINDFNEKKW